MHEIALPGCATTPLGSYLKALGVIRLVSEQKEPEACGAWSGGTFLLHSRLSAGELLAFFVDEYSPTPIVAPWNGGSGFYPNGNAEKAIRAVAESSSKRFQEYRKAIELCRSLPEVASGKEANADKEEERRTSILLQCRNRLCDRAVEWLDAAMGIAADGSRSFAPVLGTGGNEGRLDYTNNFMSRLAGLLIAPPKGVDPRQLLAASLLNQRTTALQPGAAGQYDPGRAGGPNQGPGVESDSNVNPWDLILTLEGAVAWASGIYRRQGARYRTILCSPFTVRARAVGYGSAAAKDDARAEIWTPVWERPVSYRELKVFLREGRATVQGRPAETALEFAEAAASLGVDRGVRQFVRYSLLKRRGDSYVALPAGTFPVGYRTEADLVRQLQQYLDGLASRGLTNPADDLARGINDAIYNALLYGKADRMRELMAAFGRLIKRLMTISGDYLPKATLQPKPWLDACGFSTDASVRIAAALASLWSKEAGSITRHLLRSSNDFAWSGGTLPERMLRVLDRRLLSARRSETGCNPTGAACPVDAGDATLFIEGSVDDDLIEQLLFAFCAFDWKTRVDCPVRAAEVMPVYAVLKCLFLPNEIAVDGEKRSLAADPRILSLLAAGDVEQAARIATKRLIVAGLRPLDVRFASTDADRLAAALLIPVQPGRLFGSGILHQEEEIRNHA